MIEIDDSLYYQTDKTIVDLFKDKILFHIGTTSFKKISALSSYEGKLLYGLYGEWSCLPEEELISERDESMICSGELDNFNLPGNILINASIKAPRIYGDYFPGKILSFAKHEGEYYYCGDFTGSCFSDSNKSGLVLKLSDNSLVRKGDESIISLCSFDGKLYGMHQHCFLGHTKLINIFDESESIPIESRGYTNLISFDDKLLMSDNYLICELLPDYNVLADLSESNPKSFSGPINLCKVKKKNLDNYAEAFKKIFV